MTRWLSTVHSFHCLVLSLAQTPFELSKEPGYSLLLVLLLSQLGLLGCSSGGATPRFLHLFRLGYVVFHGANGVIGLPLPGFGYYTTYLKEKRKSVLHGKWSCFVTCDSRAQGNRLDCGRTSLGKQKSEAECEKR